MKSLKDLLCELEELNSKKNFNPSGTFCSRLKELRLLTALKDQQNAKFRFFNVEGQKYFYVNGFICFNQNGIYFCSNNINFISAPIVGDWKCQILLKDNDHNVSSNILNNLKIR